MATVLVAEDDPGAREIARVVLERAGHRVIEAATGPETLFQLAGEKIDLLLLDIMMPGIDGHTLLMKLAESPSWRGLPVLVVTALNFTQDLFNKFSQVKGFLAKPYTPLALDEAVGKIIAPVAL